MTEYDYSPDAMEKYLTKQARIADWVDDTNHHEPANPFVPLVGERAPSETYPAYPQHHQPTPQYSYGYSQPQPQPQPQPAYYTTPQGVISPTYASSSKRPHHHHHHHHNGSHHTSGSKSLRPSPQTASAALPMSKGLIYAPTPQRSMSTPPYMAMPSAQGMMVPVAMTSPNAYIAYPAQQKQLYQPFVSPPLVQQPQVQGYPFSYVASPPAMAPAPSYSSARSHHSQAQAHSHSYSQSQSSPLQSPPNGQIYQSPPYQPTVVPINGGSGGYIVVPPGRSIQVLTQPASYASSDFELVQRPSGSESGSGSSHGHGEHSFFGHLNMKKFGTSLKGHKSRRRRERSRSDSS
ncbi:hypothetical protein CPB84DRAFT_1397293 [Gymnopilus junonius]|uniref:Uncharacterized protein n=1 Tax=Gymnopilus junonius TaxID=109634 RepID=A0A9P5NJH6_GYMJU|nr:hypothetical protein CPB84DRAFT_1397293 [Gymnopilus junonius]